MTLATPRLFFDSVKSVLGSLDQSEVDGCNAILAAMAGAPLAHTAYALATAFLETAGTMHPIKEYGGDRYFFKMYDIGGARPGVARALGNTTPGDGVKFAGRGYVQLTGRNNYKRAGGKLGLDLLLMPDAAMLPAAAARIMRAGMDEGWFTSRRFSSYLPANGRADRAAFVQARRIINGQDRAGDIAGFALKFQTALEAGGWA